VEARRKTLAQVFAEQRGKGRLALMPFIPAGYPDLKTTKALLPAIEEAGAACIEVGIPFSDPIADGPTIQAAFTAALAKKLKLADVFAAIREARSSVSIPLISMVSYSLVFRYGPARFFADAKAAGLDGMILPDLPPPEARPICEQVRAAGLDTTLLVAPTTPADRRREIAGLCTGFVYYLSLSGITGERDRLPPDLADNVRQLREVSKVPVCVGFGISRPEHMAQLAGLADGAIVGSAVVRRIKEHEGAEPAAISRAVRGYCQELLAYR
jgi:tryptophan synthase alpha chain